EGTCAEPRLVEVVDAVRVKLDNGVHSRVGELHGPPRGLRQLLWRNGLARDELRQPQAVLAGVFGNVHDCSLRRGWAVSSSCSKSTTPLPPTQGCAAIQT